MARATRPPGLRAALATVREAVAAASGTLKPDPVANAIRDDLVDRVLAAAAASGWALQPAAPAPALPGWRQATLTRPGERMEIMALSESVVTAWSFAESAA